MAARTCPSSPSGERRELDLEPFPEPERRTVSVGAGPCVGPHFCIHPTANRLISVCRSGQEASGTRVYRARDPKDSANQLSPDQRTGPRTVPADDIILLWSCDQTA